jgi:3-oxoacyl-[acyl-carrier protein] reductase
MTSNATTGRGSVIVTGGASGIGSDVARRLACDGWCVAVADVNAQKVAAVAADLPGGGHLAVVMDVADEASVESAFDAAEEGLGPLRALVHAAGVILTAPLGSTPPTFWEAGLDRWEQTMDVNARGTYLVSKAFMRRRVQAPLAHSRVVLFSSVSGQVGGLYADYAASKAAVLGFMRVAARECAQFGVTMNAVAPGQIDTPMLRQTLKDEVVADRRVIPVGRFGRPADVSAVVQFVLSEDTDFITGATFDVNGGQRIQ